MPTLRAGSLAYLDTTESGLVPCRVKRIYRDGYATLADVEVTATRYAYERGAAVTHSVLWVVPRDAVHGSRVFPYRLEGVEA